MIIIKEGNRPAIIKRFTCKNCGCIWEAEKGEYNVTSQYGIIHDGLKAFNMNCPCCGKIVDTN